MLGEINTEDQVVCGLNGVEDHNKRTRMRQRLQSAVESSARQSSVQIVATAILTPATSSAVEELTHT